MKHLFTFLILLSSIAVFAQKPDSVKTEPRDTLVIDLLKHDAFSRLQQVDQQRADLAKQAEALKAKLEVLQEKYVAIIDGEVRHDSRTQGRKIVDFGVAGTNLVLLLEKKKPDVKAKKP